MEDEEVFEVPVEQNLVITVPERKPKPLKNDKQGKPWLEDVLAIPDEPAPPIQKPIPPKQPAPRRSTANPIVYRAVFWDGRPPVVAAGCTNLAKTLGLSSTNMDRWIKGQRWTWIRHGISSIEAGDDEAGLKPLDLMPPKTKPRFRIDTKGNITYLSP